MRNLWLLLAVIFAPAAGAAYKCVDEKGLTHIGDTPPEACARVTILEVQKNGVVLRRIEPTPSAEQVKARQEEQERRKEAERLAADQKRTDLALLSSFVAEREFDVVRDRNIEPLSGRIRSNQERIKAIEKRVSAIEDEMEFYTAGKSRKAGGKAREAPAALVGELQRIRNDKTMLEKAITGFEKEIEVLKAKFESDKKRWVALKSAGGGAAATSPKTEPQKTRY